MSKKKDWRKYVLRKKAGFVKELGYANILYFFPKKEAILFDPFAALASAFDFADTWIFSYQEETIFSDFFK